MRGAVRSYARGRRAGWWLVALLWAVEPIALAQDDAGGGGEAAESTAPSDAESEGQEERARFLFEEGRTAFYEGRFEEALALFRRAHELSGRDALLYNIGQSLDRLRRDEEAIEVFERYLQKVPDAPNRGEVEARLQVLREAVARRRAHEAEGRGEASPSGADAVEGDGAAAVGVGASRAGGAPEAREVEPASERAASTPEATEQSTPLAPSRPAERAEGGGPAWWVWTLVGVGATLLVLGGLAVAADQANRPPEVPGADYQVRF